MKDKTLLSANSKGFKSFVSGTEDKDQILISHYATVLLDSAESGWVLLQMTSDT